MTNISIVRTKAEEGFAAAFAEVADKLPGGAAVQSTRTAAIESFQQKGLPHRRIEEWKYTDLRSAISDAAAPGSPSQSGDVDDTALDAALGSLAAIESDRMIFVDGVYQPGHSSVGDRSGLTVSSLASALDGERGAELLALDANDDAVVALNSAFAVDGAIISVDDGAELDRPLVLVFARTGNRSALITTRNVISVGRSTRATILEVYVSLDGASGGQTNTLSQISVGDGAELSHIKVGTETGNTHLATWAASVGKEADYRAFSYTADVDLARNQVFAHYTGENAKVDISGAFLARGEQHIDNTLVVTHEVPGCESRELFKGVLDDKARGVFQGKVIVHPEAQKTDGKQMAQALMLSPDCEFDSKPELEIYADDVACGHGSTCAELDPDLVFYCRSRGIPVETARALLIESFIGEAIEQVDNESIAAALLDDARGWLAR
ncbi:MAG: Fe-S cluster assembly protein SufD [Pseudomonadota bacterium]